jgi:hypothetical protein
MLFGLGIVVNKVIILHSYHELFSVLWFLIFVLLLYIDIYEIFLQYMISFW